MIAKHGCIGVRHRFVVRGIDCVLILERLLRRQFSIVLFGANKVNITARAVAVATLARAGEQARSKVVACVVAILVEALDFPVLLHAVVLFTGHCICQHIRVLGHQVIILGEHAITLHERDARRAVLVSAESTAPTIPALLDLFQFLVLKTWISVLVAPCLCIAHAGLFAERTSHDTALILAICHPVHFCSSQVHATNLLWHIRVPFKIALCLVVGRHLILRPLRNDEAIWTIRVLLPCGRYLSIVLRHSNKSHGRVHLVNVTINLVQVESAIRG